MKYLTAQQVLFIHSRVVGETGGSLGLRDLGALQSAVERPRMTFGGEDLYADLFAKTAAMMESIIGNHPFVDGNKRVGSVAAMQMLWENGYRLVAENEEVETFVMAIARGEGELTRMAARLREHTQRR
jgi:death-on-curing protein